MDEMAALRNIGQTQQSSRVSTRPAAMQRRETPKKRSTSGGWSDRTDVSTLRSGVLGLALTAAVLVVMFPLQNTYVGELFIKRGGVPFVETFLLCWSAAILYLKSRKIKRQRESMLFDLLPNELSNDITSDSVDRFVKHIEELPVQPSESFLVNRVLRGLEHFRVRNSNPEVASMLSSQSEIDANAVQSSYTLLNVFIWAIPILGFIGTVIGISAAVGGFSGSLEQANDISVLKESLNNVTGGLATAFDTTLLALVMSMMVMFPSSSMQKSEEDMLNSVDEYCNENLLKRLNDGNEGPVGDAAVVVSPALRKAIHAALAPHHAELRTWSEKLESIGSKLTAEVVQGWGSINKEIEKQQQENAEQVRDLDAMAASFLQTLSRLAEQTEKAHEEASGSMRRSAESLEGYCTALGQGLAGLNGVLAELGEKQVVIQGRRRGWFFRRPNGVRTDGKA
ncbi:MAG: MotA/TolQ/ExbB proton channel family protein [Rhodopirellula sp.]|nr:MotA/TolQ/ExbB proton channel family protein [Rhodopirellula sp.]